MTAEYSAHPALAAAQLQRAENSQHNSQSHHRRHAYNSKSLGAVGGGGGGGGGGGVGGGGGGGGSVSHLASMKSATLANSAAATTFATTDAQTKLPDRTAAVAALQKFANSNQVVRADVGEDDDVFGVDCNDINATIIEDDAEDDVSIDETDHVQHRFSRTSAASKHQLTSCSCATQFHQHLNCSSSVFDGAGSVRGGGGGSGGSRAGNVSCNGCGASSGFSSAGSSPSASTTSSPLSTPTRLVSTPNTPQHCCQKTAAGAVAASSVAATAAATASSAAAVAGAASSTTEHQQHQHPQQQQHPHLHLHHHHHPHHHNGSGCKKLQKFDPRLGPSPYRQLLPIALCILSFATVFSILIVYMDTTEIRHQQFRMNMSRNYEYGVAQDDPELIAFLREIQMNKYPMHFLKNRDTPDQTQHLNFNEHHELAPQMAHYVADLMGSKVNGTVIQTLPGEMGQVMTAPWLAGTLNWTGVIVEPEPQRFFALRKQNARSPKLHVVHACVSPNVHPQEVVTIHNEEADVRINSLLDEETSWFYSRVKCFPLYALMLACNRVEYDLLSLGVHGHELEILQTLPFEKINIQVISIHLPDDHEKLRPYLKSVTQFLKSKSYKLQKNFGRNYFYQKINSTNRTRKKDILLMKQP